MPRYDTDTGYPIVFDFQPDIAGFFAEWLSPDRV
jgi:acetone carboxylase gamma subunit